MIEGNWQVEVRIFVDPGEPVSESRYHLRGRATCSPADFVFGAIPREHRAVARRLTAARLSRRYIHDGAIKGGRATGIDLPGLCRIWLGR